LPSHPNTILVGVYDGHGGVDVSTFLSAHLPGAIDALEAVHDHKAIEDALVELDRLILLKYARGGGKFSWIAKNYLREL
jgi:serine/threonine protein phosphatase PrpC